MSYYGENLRLSIFGQSHSPAIGMCLEGVPAGFKIDMDELQDFLDRRAPGRNELMTQRKEADKPEFISGLMNGVCCGGAVTAIIRNEDCRPEDYEMFKNTPRPGHADYTANIKYRGFQDYSGGGAFSGRMTAALCAAGGICIQLLEKEGIKIHSEIISIGGETRKNKIEELIKALQAEGDSVGGIIECSVTNLPAGLGGPLFEGMEGKVSCAVFAIPGVKGIDFGLGVDSAKIRGSENNDEFAVENGKIITVTNNCGGILGGITNGMPLNFRVYIKPTPSIKKVQRSVNIETMEAKSISISGRHDPCIALRAGPCVEAAAAIAVYDAFLGRKKEVL